MDTSTIPGPLVPAFNNIIANVKNEVFYDPTEDSYFLRKDNSLLTFDYVEELLTEKLSESELSYDHIGEEEFTKVLDLGLDAIHGDEEVESEEYECDEQEEEEVDEELECQEEEYEEEEVECQEDEENEAETLHFDFIMEIIEEIKVNPDCDDEYLQIRIQNGLKTRNIDINFTE